VSRGEGKYGRTALVSGAGYPTTPGSPHPLTGSTPWPTRGPTRPRHRPPGEGKGVGDGIQKLGIGVGIGGWGKGASSGFLTPMVFQVTTRGGQVGRYVRETPLFFAKVGDLYLQWRGHPGGLLLLDAEPLWGPSPKWTSGGRDRTRIRSKASFGMAGVEL